MVLSSSKTSDYIKHCVNVSDCTCISWSASFKQLASSRPVAELMTTEETEAAAQAKAAEPAEVPIPDAEEPAPAGEVEGAVGEPEMLPESTGAEELEKYLAVRDAYYKAAKESDAKIVTHENAIRRPYFHVKPLDDGQLGNWHRYLDFIEKEGVTDKVSPSRWYGFELWSMILYTSCSFL